MDSEETVEQVRLAYRNWVLLHVKPSATRSCDVYSFLETRHQFCLDTGSREEEYLRRRTITPQDAVDLGVELSLCDKRARSHLSWVTDGHWTPCTPLQSYSAKARARAHRGSRLRKKG
jgi:hypothetical protein